VRHERYGGAELTEAGERIALQVLRHHRIIETYLAEALGIGWDEVHQEAHRLEHHVSADVQERMAALLGHPERDPHGSPIPPREGPFEPPRRSPLSQAQPYARLVVREVLDAHGETLRRLDGLGIRPDVELEVIAAPPEGPITVRVAGAEQSVDRALARAVFVDLLE
jgi:DtxR family Mn-dependent transcriptional regulator